jgi:hypothetical protein
VGGSKVVTAFMLEAENGRCLLQNPPRPGCALVVHDEFNHFAGGGVDLDGLGVLPADVDNRFRARNGGMAIDTGSAARAAEGTPTWAA